VTHGEPRWVTKEAALAIHEILLAEHGGKPGVLNEGLLQAAMDAPRNHYAYEQANPLRLAAIYAYGLIQNHPFVDGNKRVAFTVAITFLEKNGFRFEAPEQEAYSAIDDLAAGRLGREDFEAWLEGSCSRP
jgi:death-on-curing protein